jgi:hypothetical protein
VEVFKYLGRLLAYDDNDSQAMRANLKKVRKSWARVSWAWVLRAENPSPKVCGVFLQGSHAGSAAIWERDVETVSCELKKPRRISHSGCPLYGGHAAHSES